MSQLSTTPVVKCKRCGKPVTITHLSTRDPDPTGELLFKLLQFVGSNTLCKTCKRSRDYYLSINRLDDWEHGRP